MTTMIGVLAAIFSTICWIPQVLKTLRTREVKDLSLGTNVMVLTSVSLWLAYGLSLGEWPLILANIFSIICVGTIVLAKLAWGRA
ncbi:hypothetical protein CUV01_14320 [Paracoccus tegillarcae]|uniref:MtN3 and saliva related transmembrane protein n=2 Tax=Paracoccus tegillarcae TaxID=1529068 RepID=A0A2K9ERR9_9RHOB|nr:hypothetical protein CUV01_14320 [Paracoccus tegillarcae]